MARPKKKQIKLDTESFTNLLQEMYNECCEQRSKALFVFNKQSVDIKDNNDIALVSKINSDYLKIVNESIEKKLSIARLMKDVIYKEDSNKKDSTDGGSLSDEDKELISKMLIDAANKQNLDFEEYKND